MVEYILDVIRATAGEDISITATISDAAEGKTYYFILFNEDGTELIKVPGVFVIKDTFTFDIPAAITAGHPGKYWYLIKEEDISINFKTPFYLT